MVSVIIPAYKATKYIDECISSINSDIEYEILIGVDACIETFNVAKKHECYNIRVFYFTENVGPYVIKNTLVDEAKYENILFFDSDDVLAEGTINRVNDILLQCEYASLKYINFTNNINKQGHMMNDAVICIKKALFNSLNGFYNWRCGADTEFSKRLEHNNIKTKSFDGVCYYRRLCPTSLTHAKETGHGSPLRQSYVQIINKNQSTKLWPNPLNKITQEYDKDTTTS
jgi:glycosyltransferase involved in cell wall biosynthesis